MKKSAEKLLKRNLKSLIAMMCMKKSLMMVRKLWGVDLS